MEGLRPELLSGLPRHIYDTIRQLEDSFVVSTPGLKIITDRFERELQRGLTVEGGDIVTDEHHQGYGVLYPTGKEQGQYLVVDLGGTKLRVCDVFLAGRDEGYQITQEKYDLPLNLRTDPADHLWNYIADCVSLFIHQHHNAGQTSKKLPLAFTFSYPVTQTSISDGVLQHWTKSFDVPGVEGHDVVPRLQAALDRKKVPAEIVALVNDTAGTLIASAYRDPEVQIGSIVSTGCNAAYMEDCASIAKIETNRFPEGGLVAINTEYGAFDNRRDIIPLTNFDETVDRISSHPGTQIYEKMVAGEYLSELLRVVLFELHKLGILFGDQDISREQLNVINASFLQIVEDDITESLGEIHTIFKDQLGLDLNPDELKVCRYLVELIGTWASRFYACGIAAICKRRNIESCRVGVDGAVFNHWSHFRERASHALREILDWPFGTEDKVTFVGAPDGSGVGAALIAALAVERRGGGTFKARQNQ